MPIAYCMSAYPNQEINFARLLSLIINKSPLNTRLTHPTSSIFSKKIDPPSGGKKRKIEKSKKG
ncbi:hypothetical protein C789_1961 [Microcystis aeruginosa FACHB-905 = DIANCHI905]|uniref:Uncharacterized protein n=1 Tax=Microcystis aeruginosa PCC 7806SL TaxID=1903187 RepID=A0AB33BQN6_MICA7|nr:hypothetical protein BH695_0998 [Microcystis aeruginosa PCC 7806SL]ELS48241.1 hypothetical protein C789_1961 [Microcystis aeruginosa FACHB-905 = DIANCHI905]